MGIMALLLALGVGALLSARTSSEVDAVAEKLVSTIRQAQNNAISIKNEGCNSSTTKAWGVSIINNDFEQKVICGFPMATPRRPGGPQIVLLSPYSDVKITRSGDSTLSTSIFFAAPFGKGYIFLNDPDGHCQWKASSLPTQEYIPDITAKPTECGSFAANPLSSTQQLVISKAGYSRTITIQANGDVSEN